jgi:hypothetical protein
MNLGTMEQDIYETLHSLVSTTKIRHRILSAIRFHREKHYLFSERKFEFALTPNRSDYRPGDGYGLPGDLVEILGDTLWYRPEGSSQPQSIPRFTREGMEWERAMEAGSTGEPEVWDWFAQALRLSPTPDDPDTIYGFYVRDIGVPQKSYASGTWTFKTPDGAETLADDYTSHWFDLLGGYGLIKHRALYLCYTELLQDPANAQAEQVTWLEERQRLEDETEGHAPTMIEPRMW